MLKRGPRKASTMGVVVDSQLPHLVGMDDDILSTGVIIYHLRVGSITSFIACIQTCNKNTENMFYNL